MAAVTIKANLALTWLNRGEVITVELSPMIEGALASGVVSLVPQDPLPAPVRLVPAVSSPPPALPSVPVPASPPEAPATPPPVGKQRKRS